LKQYNSNSALATKSCKRNGGGVGLSFHWDTFGIEGIIREKMVTLSFGGAALDVSHACALT